MLTSDAATATTDYTTLAGADAMASFAATETTAMVSLDIESDTLVEGTERLQVAISSVTSTESGQVIGELDKAFVYILDNDLAGI